MSRVRRQLHEREWGFAQPSSRTHSAARALIYGRTGSSRAGLVGSFVFALHELARQPGINYFPGKDFIVTAPAAGVERGIDLRFPQRRVQIAFQTRRSFDDARDASIAGREQRLFVGDARRHRADFDVGKAGEVF